MPRPEDYPTYEQYILSQRLERDTKNYEEKQNVRELTLENCLTAQKVYDKAKAEDKWLYDAESKRWYTPDEFLDIYKEFHRNHPIFHKIQYRNPAEGIKAGYTKLAQLQVQVFDFIKKVSDYYQRKS